MPIQCHHCEDAPCLKSCLAKALSRAEDGAVVINKERCIGCKACVMACPFGAAQVINGGKPAVAYKCDFCEGIGDPACVAACPNKALRVMDMEEETHAKRVEAVAALDSMYETSGAPVKGV
jgi:electron transport protein HydN